jgi:hypothetical protein
MNRLKFLHYLFKNKIIFNFVIFVASKKVGQQIFSPGSSFVVVVEFGIGDPGLIKIRIRDQHPVSATLVWAMLFLVVQFSSEHVNFLAFICYADTNSYR